MADGQVVQVILLSQQFSFWLKTPSFRHGCRTNRQDSRFARLRRPKGEGQGCPECIQAMPVLSEVEGDGNLSRVQALELANEVSKSLPSLDAGFWHPCQNDGSTAYT